IFDRESTCPLNSAGLVIHGAAGTVPKTGSSDCYLIANGILQKITASTDMPALSGTVVNATFNVFCFFIDSAGTKTSAMGTAGTTLAKVVFPQFPKQKALIGFIIINPTGTGNFVGGTTALDDGTVVPNTVYVSPTGGFDPACLIG
ncbi:MAG: hypothetical protein KGJ13_11085, partial [Patescibacteria group bacterium]|nr:hypothetical protein [Patescibacteria group bacterium]